VRGAFHLAAFAVAALGLALGCAARGSANAGFIPEDAGVDASLPPHDAGLFTPSDEAGAILGNGCATAKAPIERDPIYMLVVLDGSLSMKEDTKWDAIVPALEEFIDTLQSLHDRSFGLGLTIFSDTNDPTKGNGPYDTIDVPIAYVDAPQAIALKIRLGLAQPSGQTPTYSVLSGQYPLLQKFVPTAPLLTERGHKVLVLMTDGIPTPDTAVQQPKCVQAVKDAFALTAPGGPITTLAVGIGHTFPLDQTVYDPLFMAQLALAGGAPNEPCAPYEIRYESNMCHFQITPLPSSDPTQLQLALMIAFDKIRSRVTSCELPLDKSGVVDPSLVNVLFTDAHNVERVVPEDATDGWTYDDAITPTKVILHGKACQNLKDNPSGDVEVVLGCKTIVK
jgi:hypothetical protein